MDKAVFAQMVSEPDFQNYVLRFAKKRCLQIGHGPHEAPDLVQWALMNAWKTVANIREPKYLKSYVCKAITNCNNMSDRTKISKAVRGACSLDDVKGLLQVSGKQHAHAVAGERKALLNRGLSKLAPSLRTVLVLSMDEREYSDGELAQTLNMSLSAFKSKKSRGRQQLKEVVSEMVSRKIPSKPPTKILESTLHGMAAHA